MNRQMQHFAYSEDTTRPTVAAQTTVAEKGIEKETDPFVHAMVEDYLDRVCQPLIDTHSYTFRNEMRLELTQHIYSLITAYTELGDSQLVATEKALAKFGPAESVARQWKSLPTTVRRVPLRKWLRKQWPGIASTLAACGLCMAVLSVSAVRYNRQQVRMLRAQAEAQRPQEVTIAANSGFHHTWALHARCTECHRTEMTQEVNTTFRLRNTWWQIAQARR